MKDISDAADLLDTARGVLLDELLPALTKNQRYVGLMVANAMAIAVREQQAGGDAQRREAERLRGLLGAIGMQTGAAGGESDETELQALRRSLSAAIRAGRFDDAQHASALQTQLAETATEWAAISNPKALRSSRAA